MQSSGKVQIPWAEIDTLLLDMDGTLLDLAFDNYFWLDVVPKRYAEAKCVDHATARKEIKSRYESVVGTLPWYCLDHWTEQLGLDIRALKREYSHLIRFLPQAEAFLDASKLRGKRLILVTNAHRDTIKIKSEMTGVHQWMDVVVSSHDYGVPKEDLGFWRELTQRTQIDPMRSMLIEDSLPVLKTARAFGIAHTVAVRCPDTRLAPKNMTDFMSVLSVGELV